MCLPGESGVFTEYFHKNSLRTEMAQIDWTRLVFYNIENNNILWIYFKYFETTGGKTTADLLATKYNCNSYEIYGIRGNKLLT